ncbi:MAG: TfoX/Sxy family protein [Pseudomonadota bacterium]
MSVSSEDIAFATDLFAGLGDITTRRMMGGLCLYHDGTIFAILHPDGGLMIKGAGAFQAELEAMGVARWRYQRAGKTETAMPYWELPSHALDDPEEAVALARRALAHL